MVVGWLVIDLPWHGPADSKGGFGATRVVHGYKIVDYLVNSDFLDLERRFDVLYRPI